MVETPTLRGSHVLLRPLVLDDADDLARAAAESREHYGFTDVPDGIDDARRFIADAFELAAAGERMAFAVEWDGQVVGTTSYWEMRPWRWLALPRPALGTGLTGFGSGSWPVETRSTSRPACGMRRRRCAE